MMDNNNNNNMMELNTEESQKKREKQEKVNNFKKKLKGFKDKFQEEREDRKRAKEEKKRVKAEEKQIKESQKAPQKSIQEEPLVKFTEPSSTPTVTNETIKKPKNNNKKQLTPHELREKKRKRKKIIRNIMTIPEIIIVVALALFLKNKYLDYSKNVHQILNYAADQYVYEIHRDNDSIKVSKNVQETCEKQPCNLKRISDYEIKFNKTQMTIIRLFMDLKFHFKSATKTITIDDLKTEVGKRSIYSMIHNNASFLSTDTYKKYEVIDYEQMSGYPTKGYKYEPNGNTGNLYVAMGEKETSGYALIVNQAYKKGDTIYFYIKEQKPSGDENNLSLVTHPMVQVALEENPANILVYNIESGEEYKNLDAPEGTSAKPAKENDKGVTGIIGEMQTNLKDVFK